MLHSTFYLTDKL